MSLFYQIRNQRLFIFDYNFGKGIIVFSGVISDHGTSTPILLKFYYRNPDTHFQAINVLSLFFLVLDSRVVYIKVPLFNEFEDF